MHTFMHRVLTQKVQALGGLNQLNDAWHKHERVRWLAAEGYNHFVIKLFTSCDRFGHDNHRQANGVESAVRSKPKSANTKLGGGTYIWNRGHHERCGGCEFKGKFLRFPLSDSGTLARHSGQDGARKHAC